MFCVLGRRPISLNKVFVFEHNSRAPVLLNLLSLSRKSDKILFKPRISSLFTICFSILGSNVIFYALQSRMDEPQASGNHNGRLLITNNCGIKYKTMFDLKYNVI